MGSEPQTPKPAPPEPTPPPGPAAQLKGRRRLPLGRKGRRMSYDLRLRLWLTALALPVVGCGGLLAYVIWSSSFAVLAAGIAAMFAYAALAVVLFEGATRPLETLSNVVSAMRDDDFSFRARGGRRGDSLGDLALEINALAGTLQAQRGSARDALTLAERVMHAMRTPVLAFAADRTLRLLNPAAAHAFALTPASAIGQSAEALGLEPLFSLADGAIHTHPDVSGVAGETRWSLRRSSFRLGGVPHTLFVLSDVQAALREEERLAWQRLIRVLSHEINNSLTPITSLAGSLRARLPFEGGHVDSVALPEIADLRRGLHLIEDRAFSLHRFLQAYQALARLPRPSLQEVSVSDLLHRVASLETRAAVKVLPGPPLWIRVDPAQIEQLLINLLRNAAEAAESIATSQSRSSVEVAWTATATELAVRVEDNGPGITDTANLFVPFYTTKPEGSGIGLALAKQIAAGHGGTLTLTNKTLSSGCLAELRLPLTGCDAGPNNHGWSSRPKRP